MNELKTLTLLLVIDTSNLVKNDECDTNVGEIQKEILDHYHNSQYITTRKFNRLMAEHFTARIEQAKLATKTDIDNFVEKRDFDDTFKKLK